MPITPRRLCVVGETGEFGFLRVIAIKLKDIPATLRRHNGQLEKKKGTENCLLAGNTGVTLSQQKHTRFRCLLVDYESSTEAQQQHPAGHRREAVTQ